MKILVEEEVVRQALDVLSGTRLGHWNPDAADEAIIALRSALDAAEKADPVAWLTHESQYRLKQGGNCKGAVPVHQNKSITAKIPLYLHPPSTEIWSLRKDAARYRWLRAREKTSLLNKTTDFVSSNCMRPEELDAAIDTARAAEGEKL